MRRNTENGTWGFILILMSQRVFFFPREEEKPTVEKCGIMWDSHLIVRSQQALLGLFNFHYLFAVSNQTKN